MSEPIAVKIMSTGTPGLDNVLGGGLPPGRLYLIQGDPGTGKTTLALQFLFQGLKENQKVLFIALSETRDELMAVAKSHGWSMEGIEIYELSTAQQNRVPQQNTLFHPSEVELAELTQSILKEIERVRPDRIVIDSLSEMRLLAQNALRFRRQILALKQFFNDRPTTVLLLDDRMGVNSEAQAHTVVHGVIELEQMAPEYGASRRRLSVIKLRGVKYRGGYHDYTIVTGGIVVFPRLIAAEHHPGFKADRVPSGVDGLDRLLGGGVDRGTSVLLMGPAGSGKSTVAMQYALAAAQRGEATAMFAFDESVETMLRRGDSIGLDVRGAIQKNLIFARQVDPAELSPGEFIQHVRDSVTRNHAKIVVIDSLNGYLNAMPEERFLTLHMHELLTYLGQHGVMTILIMAQHGLMGRMESPLDISYLSDTVLLLRYFEAIGAIRQAISVIKKRTGAHERTLREFQIGAGGVHVGEPLNEFQGILTGVPQYRGDHGPLLKRNDGV
ncbi:MAG TPA: ATPase domain-containing protein [Tepidisphaeraceae bacterium]